MHSLQKICVLFNIFPVKIDVQGVGLHVESWYVLTVKALVFVFQLIKMKI